MNSTLPYVTDIKYNIKELSLELDDQVIGQLWKQI